MRMRKFCRRCGMALAFHEATGLFFCEACEIEYEREAVENPALEQANATLESGEFDTAILQFRDILMREPHNPVALRGAFLCNAEITGPDFLTKDSTWQFHTDRADNIREFAPEPYKTYFDQYGDISEYNDRLKMYKEDFDALEGERDKLQKRYDVVPKKMKTSSIVVLVLVCLVIGLVLAGIIDLILFLVLVLITAFLSEAYMDSGIVLLISAAVPIWFLISALLMWWRFSASKAKLRKGIQTVESLLDDNKIKEDRLKDYVADTLKKRDDAIRTILSFEHTEFWTE